MTLGDAWTCAECADLQTFDPFALCGPHSDYYRAPLREVEEHLHTGPERAEDTGEGEGGDVNRLLLIGIPVGGMAALIGWGLVDYALQRRKWATR